VLGNQRWKRATACVFVALLLPIWVVIRRTHQYGWEYYLTFGPGHFLFGRQTTASLTIDGVEMRVIRDRSPTVFLKIAEVRGHELHWTTDDAHFEIGATLQDETTIIGRGEDITGNGVPDLILTAYSGGAHCCYTFFIFEIEAPGRFREVAAIHASHGGRFEDVNADGAMDFVMADWTWAYALTCFACLSPPEVVLLFTDGSFEIAPEFMLGPPPAETPEQFAARMRSRSNGSELNDPVPLYDEMLKRIYAGHAESAWHLFNAVWKPEFGEREQARRHFCEVLSSSPYVEALREMNGGRLEPFSSVEHNAAAVPSANGS